VTVSVYILEATVTPNPLR